MNKKLIIFMPSIEGGGVEKNLFIISNFLRKKKFDIKLITSSKYHIKKFHGIQRLECRIGRWRPGLYQVYRKR